MLLRLRVDRALVDGAGDDVVDVDRLRVLERVVALQPRQLDDLLHQPAQPRALGLHAAREPDHRLRVVGRLLHRLGEQVQRADRRLELVGDVRHEVTADGLDAALPGAVLDECEHEPAAQRRDTCGDVLWCDAPATRDDQLGLADLPVATHLPDEVGQLLHGHLPPAHHAERVGRRRGLDDLVLLVDDEGAGAEHAEHGRDAGGHGRLASTGARWCIWRSLTSHARVTPAPSTTPSKAKSSACVVLSTNTIVRTPAPGVRRS